MAYSSMRTGGGSTSPTGYEPAYGGIPNLPAYTTDTSKMVGTDVQANLVRNLPNYMGMVGADVSNIGQNLAGVLSPDVIQQMQQQAAERGVSTGAPGAPNTNAAYLRALGLTSLQLQQLGHSQLTQAMARTPVQQTQDQSMTRDLGAERAIYAAAPVPGAAARQALLNAQMGMSRGQGLVGGAPSYAAFTGGGGGGSAPLRSTGWTDYGTPTAVGRTGYFPEESNQNLLPSYYGSAYSGASLPPNTYYDPGADTYNYDYGMPPVYSQGPPPNTYYDPATDTSKYDYGIPQYYS